MVSKNKILVPTLIAIFGSQAVGPTLYESKAKNPEMLAQSKPAPAPITPLSQPELVDAVYKIETGNKLWDIARKYYFENKKTKDIVKEVAEYNDLKPDSILNESDEVSIKLSYGKDGIKSFTYTIGYNKTTIEQFVNSVIAEMTNEISKANDLGKETDTLSVMSIEDAVKKGLKIRKNYDNGQAVVEQPDDILGDEGKKIRPNETLTIPGYKVEKEPVQQQSPPPQQSSKYEQNGSNAVIGLAQLNPLPNDSKFSGQKSLESTLADMHKRVVAWNNFNGLRYNGIAYS